MAKSTGRDRPFTGPALTDTQARILTHLREEVDGTAYFKSKFIAKRLDLSAKEVGVNMQRLQEHSTGIQIEQWGSSSSTTWKVTD